MTAEDFLAYVYGALAQPAFTERFAEELGTRELRVPLTKDAALFAEVRDAGAKLLWLHTYGQRFVPKGKRAGRVPRGEARCTKPVPGDEAGYPETFEYNDAAKILHVGAGRFGPSRGSVRVRSVGIESRSICRLTGEASEGEESRRWTNHPAAGERVHTEL